MAHIFHSEAGHHHENEDAIDVRIHPTDRAVLLCALADGQGGRPGGAAAAKIAVEKCPELASTYSAKQLLDGPTWLKILNSADDAVAADPGSGYTTLMGFCVVDDKVCGASSGDSAVLLVKGEHSLLTERQRKNPPVGTGAAFPVAFSAKLKPGFQLLAVSDGVWKYVGWETIIQLCGKHVGRSLISALKSLTLEQNGGKLPDDFSIALIQ